MAEVNPKELLWGILLSLSKQRGARPYFLTELLERSKDLFTMHNPLTLNNPLAMLPAEGAEQQHRINEFDTWNDNNTNM